MRSVAPRASGESRSRAARTGAPASASTALMPTVRSSVLLPDMFEPLTIRTRVGAAERHVVAHAARLGDQRVAERLRLEARLALLDRREDVGRVLARVARQRAQGLELPDGREPRPDGGAVPGPPGLDGERAVHAPHGQQRERREELVAPRVEQVDPDAQRAAPPRGTPAVGDQVRVEPVEQRAPERLALEALEHRGQQLEVRSVPGHRPVGVPHVRRAAASRPRPWTASAASATIAGAQPAAHDATTVSVTAVTRGGAEAKAACAADARRRRQGWRARRGWTRRRHLLAEDGQVLAEVEARASAPARPPVARAPTRDPRARAARRRASPRPCSSARRRAARTASPRRRGRGRRRTDGGDRESAPRCGRRPPTVRRGARARAGRTRRRARPGRGAGGRARERRAGPRTPAPAPRATTARAGPTPKASHAISDGGQRETEAGPRDPLLEPRGVRHALLMSRTRAAVLLPGRRRRQPATLLAHLRGRVGRRLGAHHLALIVRSS